GRGREGEADRGPPDGPAVRLGAGIGDGLPEVGPPGRAHRPRALPARRVRRYRRRGHFLEPPESTSARPIAASHVSLATAVPSSEGRMPSSLVIESMEK